MAPLTRTRTKTVLVISTSDHTWVEDEKKKLFVGIKKYGYLDIENISKYVGTKSCDKVRIYMKSLATLATKHQNEGKQCSHLKACRKLKGFKCGKVKHTIKFIEKHKCQCKKSPLSFWTKQLKILFRTSNQDMSVYIANAFLHISKFEDHPPPEECGGLDFKEIYMCLYLMGKGLPPKKMSLQNSKFMVDVIKTAASSIQTCKMDEMNQFLKNLKLHEPIRTYKSKAKLSEKALQELESVKGMNPFKFPLSYLKRQNFIFQLNIEDGNKEVITEEANKELMNEEANKELMIEEANNDKLIGEVFIELITGEDINEEVITEEMDKKVITDEVNNEDVITGKVKEEVPGSMKKQTEKCR